MQRGEPMDVDHDDLPTIVKASKRRLEQIGSEYLHRGTCIDLYKFCYKKHGWLHGHIFHATKVQDLSFSGIVGDIKAPNSINTRAAQFVIQHPDELDIAEDMMERSSNLKQLGVLKPYVAGFNTQISKVVSGFSSPSSRLLGWLAKNKPARASPISIEVQQLIRTGFLAIEMIWSKGSTSDDLAYAATYRMIDDRLKINPLCTRKWRAGENDKMPLRRAFGKMIRDRIFEEGWRDDELLDFIVLLGSPAAREVSDVVGHPVLLLPSERELLYHKYDREVLTVDQKRWLQNHIRPPWRWKENAKRLDKTFEKIIDFQVEQEEKNLEMKRAKEGQQAEKNQKAEGFRRDFAGALHFASVCTAHYAKHFKDIAEDKWTVNLKGKVDSQLKEVMPRLLTRRYNAKYVAPEVFAPPPPPPPPE